MPPSGEAAEPSQPVRARRRKGPICSADGDLRLCWALGPCHLRIRPATITGMSEESPLPSDHPPTPSAADADPIPSRRGAVEPLRLRPLVPRRPAPRLLVEVDGSAAGQGALVWALREAARREGTVVAIAVLDEPDDAPLGARPTRRDATALLDQVEAQVLRAIAETGVHGRTRTSVVDRIVFEALTAAAHGADLVVVGPEGKTLLRPAVPRPPGRRLARGA
jgi:nucleotide-binding universal stress UspA family protein